MKRHQPLSATPRSLAAAKKNPSRVPSAGRGNTYLIGLIAFGESALPHGASLCSIPSTGTPGLPRTDGWMDRQPLCRRPSRSSSGRDPSAGWCRLYGSSPFTPPRPFANHRLGCCLPPHSALPSAAAPPAPAQELEVIFPLLPFPASFRTGSSPPLATTFPPSLSTASGPSLGVRFTSLLLPPQ